MIGPARKHCPPALLTTRRGWLAGLIASGLGALGAGAPAKKAVARAADVEEIRARAKAVGLSGVKTSVSEHYLSVGDAADEFRAGALDVCEGLATSFARFFREKQFEIKFPAERMVIVALAGRQSYEAFTGEPSKKSEGGLYDVAADRLVIFKFGGGDEVGDPTLANTFTLVHEAMHQLSFSTGPLDRQADVPVAVSEGFATYGELWRRGQKMTGRKNVFRLTELKKPGGNVEWVPLRDLLTKDDLFFDAETEQIAYGESWLLVYEMLSNRTKAKKFQKYLERLRTRRDPALRESDAESTLGDLDKLDAALRRAASLMA